MIEGKFSCSFIACCTALDMHVTRSSYIGWLLCHVVVVDNPKIRGLAAPSTLTMNQELEGHKGNMLLQIYFYLLEIAACL